MNALRQVGLCLFIVFALGVALSRDVLASWWGPPSCDDATVTDDIIRQIKQFQENSMRSSGNNLGAGLLKELHYRHVTKSDVEITSIGEIESDSKSRTCLLKTRFYFDPTEAEAVISELRDNQELKQVYAMLRGNPQFEKWISLYTDGFYNEINYKVFYNTDNSVDFVVNTVR
jgi:hypothetical protein